MPRRQELATPVLPTGLVARHARMSGFGAGQLAWLTDDMLKPSTRTGGMAARLK